MHSSGRHRACLQTSHYLTVVALQIMGALAKRVFPQAWGVPSATVPSNATAPSEGDGGGSMSVKMDAPRGVFHVAIAQCYDKKLEASRKDFRYEADALGGAGEGQEAVQEVDLVLTTAEVLELIEERANALAANDGGNPALSNLSSFPGVTRDTSARAGSIADTPQVDVAGEFFRRQPAADLARPLGPGFPVGQAAVSADGLSLLGGVNGEGAAGGNSGGYLEHVFRYAALRLFGRSDLAGKPLMYREGRNSDFRETSLEVSFYHHIACVCCGRSFLRLRVLLARTD